MYDAGYRNIVNLDVSPPRFRSQPSFVRARQACAETHSRDCHFSRPT
jgi:hypothetical protein